jgi:RimJ/RimL family protein N-acetyltransferase
MLTTPRLRLRQWQDADYPAFAALNADPRVMQWMRAPLTPVQSDDMAGKSRAHIDANAWGLWAVEVLQTGAFAGCVGLLRTSFEASFTPCVEIMWRLA